MGVMAWKSVPPTSRGAEVADRPVMKVRMVTASREGVSTGSTTRSRIFAWEAPMFWAASTVWKSTERMALRRKIMWLEVQAKVITNSTAQYPWNQLVLKFGKMEAKMLVRNPLLP